MNEDIDAHVNTTSNAATGVVMADGPEADYVAGNYLSYYDQYIKYLNGTMNGDDSLVVLTLAGLCPYTDGEIVYSARTLAAVLGANVATNDEDCATNAANKGNPTVYDGGHFDGNAEQKYKLYPNPNNGTITISQLVADSRGVSIEVVDAMGRSVYNSTPEFDQQIIRLQLPNVSAGLYLLKLTNADGKVFNYKFVVQ